MGRRMYSPIARCSLFLNLQPLPTEEAGLDVYLEGKTGFQLTRSSSTLRPKDWMFVQQPHISIRSSWSPPQIKNAATVWIWCVTFYYSRAYLSYVEIWQISWISLGNVFVLSGILPSDEVRTALLGSALIFLSFPLCLSKCQHVNYSCSLLPDGLVIFDGKGL